MCCKLVNWSILKLNVLVAVIITLPFWLVSSYQLRLSHHLGICVQEIVIQMELDFKPERCELVWYWNVSNLPISWINRHNASRMQVEFQTILSCQNSLKAKLRLFFFTNETLWTMITLLNSTQSSYLLISKSLEICHDLC